MGSSKKDFSTINADRVYSAIETANARKGQQGGASPAEAAARAEELRTQGRKGCRAVRINMAFTPSNHEFIKIMARASGHTMTEYLNRLVEAYRKEHADQLEQARAFYNTITLPGGGDPSEDPAEDPEE